MYTLSYSPHYSPLLHPTPLNVFHPPPFSFQSHVVVCVHMCAHVCVCACMCVCVCVPTLEVVLQVLSHWPDVHHVGYTAPSLRSKDLPISAPWQSGVLLRLSLFLLSILVDSPPFSNVCFVSPNSGSHAGEASTLLTESSLQSCLSHFSFASCFLNWEALFSGPHPLAFSQHLTSSLNVTL